MSMPAVRLFVGSAVIIYFGLPSVTDTGQFGGGDAVSICNEPKVSQDQIA